MFCREKTFQFNAPYAPGVTGIRLSSSELDKLHNLRSLQAEGLGVLKKVVSECVAENLLVTRPSQASTSREGGLVFYLNRTLCINYGLPLQMGGWQDVKAEEMFSWMHLGRTLTRKKLLETN